MPRFSVIVPVYNRPDEVADLLESLLKQTCSDFEVILVEDGSTVPCENQAKKAADKGLDVKYFARPNEGRSIARNYGMEHAGGQWFVFFDSDCVIPPAYFETVGNILDSRNAAGTEPDCYGGPDMAHDSFSDVQKAINYSMTSFLTTGGIRGGKISLEKFVPRTFNMGFRREVYDRVGGFREMFSEDIDMSTRIRQDGFTTDLFHEAGVWHKRRLDWKRFWRQVHVFGMSRITLKLLYPGSLKAVHTLPALFTLGSVLLVVLAIVLSPWWLLPLGIYFMLVAIGALLATHSLKIALLAVPAAAIQLYGYGTGFIKAYFTKIILRRGRNVNDEIEMRRGK